MGNGGVSRGWSVAAGFSDRWKVTFDTLHVTHDIFITKSVRKVTKSAKNVNKWLKSDQKCKKVSKRRYFIVLVLLYSHAERVGVSRMGNFLFLFY